MKSQNSKMNFQLGFECREVVVVVASEAANRREGNVEHSHNPESHSSKSTPTMKGSAHHCSDIECSSLRG
jgi:hypothetical protein